MVGATSQAFSPPSPARTANPKLEMFAGSLRPALALRRSGRCCEPLDHGQDLRFHLFGRQRTNMAVTDVARRIDDVGLGHAVHSEIDRRSPVAVDTDPPVWVAETIEKTARIFGLVFVGDPRERYFRLARQHHQLRVLFASWCAPCREEHPELMVLARQPEVTLAGIAYKD